MYQYYILTLYYDYTIIIPKTVPAGVSFASPDPHPLLGVQHGTVATPLGWSIAGLYPVPDLCLNYWKVRWLLFFGLPSLYNIYNIDIYIYNVFIYYIYIYILYIHYMYYI